MRNQELIKAVKNSDMITVRQLSVEGIDAHVFDAACACFASEPLEYFLGIERIKKYLKQNASVFFQGIGLAIESQQFGNVKILFNAIGAIGLGDQLNDHQGIFSNDLKKVNILKNFIHSFIADDARLPDLKILYKFICLLGLEQLIRQQLHGDNTPLHVACQNNCVKTVRWLLADNKLGSGLFSTINQTGDTPFRCAVKNSHVQILQILSYEQNCRSVIKKFCADKQVLATICYLPALSDESKVAVLQWLLRRYGNDLRHSTLKKNVFERGVTNSACRNGFERFVRNLEGYQDLKLALELVREEGPVQRHYEVLFYMMSDSVLPDNPKIQQYIQQSGISVDVLVQLGSEQIPLVRVVTRKGFKNLLLWMVDQGVDYHVPGLVHDAIVFNQLDILQYLLDNLGLSANALVQDEESALMCACRLGYGSIIQYLIDYPRVNVQFKKGELLNALKNTKERPIFEELLLKKDKVKHPDDEIIALLRELAEYIYAVQETEPSALYGRLFFLARYNSHVLTKDIFQKKGGYLNFQGTDFNNFNEGSVSPVGKLFEFVRPTHVRLSNATPKSVKTILRVIASSSTAYQQTSKTIDLRNNDLYRWRRGDWEVAFGSVARCIVDLRGNQLDQMSSEGWNGLLIFKSKEEVILDLSDNNLERQHHIEWFSRAPIFSVIHEAIKNNSFLNPCLFAPEADIISGLVEQNTLSGLVCFLARCADDQLLTGSSDSSLESVGYSPAYLQLSSLFEQYTTGGANFYLLLLSFRLQLPRLFGCVFLREISDQVNLLSNTLRASLQEIHKEKQCGEIDSLENGVLGLACFKLIMRLNEASADRANFHFWLSHLLNFDFKKDLKIYEALKRDKDSLKEVLGFLHFLLPDFAAALCQKILEDPSSGGEVKVLALAELLHQKMLNQPFPNSSEEFLVHITRMPFSYAGQLTARPVGRLSAVRRESFSLPKLPLPRVPVTASSSEVVLEERLAVCPPGMPSSDEVRALIQLKQCKDPIPELDVKIAGAEWTSNKAFQRIVLFLNRVGPWVGAEPIIQMSMVLREIYSTEGCFISVQSVVKKATGPTYPFMMVLYSLMSWSVENSFSHHNISRSSSLRPVDSASSFLIQFIQAFQVLKEEPLVKNSETLLDVLTVLNALIAFYQEQSSGGVSVSRVSFQLRSLLAVILKYSYPQQEKKGLFLLNQFQLLVESFEKKDPIGSAAIFANIIAEFVGQDHQYYPAFLLVNRVAHLANDYWSGANFGQDFQKIFSEFLSWISKSCMSSTNPFVTYWRVFWGSGGFLVVQASVRSSLLGHNPSKASGLLAEWIYKNIFTQNCTVEVIKNQIDQTLRLEDEAFFEPRCFYLSVRTVIEGVITNLSVEVAQEFQAIKKCISFERHLEEVARILCQSDSKDKLKSFLEFLTVFEKLLDNVGLSKDSYSFVRHLFERTKLETSKDGYDFIKSIAEQISKLAWVEDKNKSFLFGMDWKMVLFFSVFIYNMMDTINRSKSIYDQVRSFLGSIQSVAAPAGMDQLASFAKIMGPILDSAELFSKHRSHPKKLRESLWNLDKENDSPGIPGYLASGVAFYEACQDFDSKKEFLPRVATIMGGIATIAEYQRLPTIELSASIAHSFLDAYQKRKPKGFSGYIKIFHDVLLAEVDKAKNIDPELKKKLLVAVGVLSSAETAANFTHLVTFINLQNLSELLSKIDKAVGVAKDVKKEVGGALVAFERFKHSGTITEGRDVSGWASDAAAGVASIAGEFLKSAAGFLPVVNVVLTALSVAVQCYYGEKILNELRAFKASMEQGLLDINQQMTKNHEELQKQIQKDTASLMAAQQRAQEEIRGLFSQMLDLQANTFLSLKKIQDMQGKAIQSCFAALMKRIRSFCNAYFETPEKFVLLLQNPVVTNCQNLIEDIGGYLDQDGFSIYSPEYSGFDKDPLSNRWVAEQLLGRLFFFMQHTHRKPASSRPQAPHINMYILLLSGLTQLILKVGAFNIDVPLHEKGMTARQAISALFHDHLLNSIFSVASHIDQSMTKLQSKESFDVMVVPASNSGSHDGFNMSVLAAYGYMTGIPMHLDAKWNVGQSDQRKLMFSAIEKLYEQGVKFSSVYWGATLFFLNEFLDALKATLTPARHSDACRCLSNNHPVLMEALMAEKENRSSDAQLRLSSHRNNLYLENRSEKSGAESFDNTRSFHA